MHAYARRHVSVTQVMLKRLEELIVKGDCRMTLFTGSQAVADKLMAATVLEGELEQFLVRRAESLFIGCATPTSCADSFVQAGLGDDC